MRLFSKRFLPMKDFYVWGIFTHEKFLPMLSGVLLLFGLCSGHSTLNLVPQIFLIKYF